MSAKVPKTKLLRAGLAIEFSKVDGQYYATSKYWDLPEITGATESECYAKFVQHAHYLADFVDVAVQLLGRTEGFDQVDEDTDLHEPNTLWNHIVDEVFRRAYDRSPPDQDTINRVYAFSEWCNAQPSADGGCTQLMSDVTISFYELIPLIAAALADLPNWFCYEEVVNTFLSNPFMSSDVEAIQKAYGRFSD